MHLCTPSFPISECQRDRIAACGKVKPEPRIVFETLTAHSYSLLHYTRALSFKLSSESTTERVRERRGREDQNDDDDDSA